MMRAAALASVTIIACSACSEQSEASAFSIEERRSLGAYGHMIGAPEYFPGYDRTEEISAGPDFVAWDTLLASHGKIRIAKIASAGCEDKTEQAAAFCTFCDLRVFYDHGVGFIADIAEVRIYASPETRPVHQLDWAIRVPGKAAFSHSDQDIHAARDVEFEAIKWCRERHGENLAFVSLHEDLASFEVEGSRR